MTISDYLIIAQTVFFATFSLVIIVVGILLGIVIYYLVKIARHINKISENVEHASAEIADRIEDVIEKLQALPLVSLFFKKSKRKGR